MKYDAFISYSTDPDYKLSRKLEKFLENFYKEAGQYDSQLKRLEICRDGSNFRLSNKTRDQETINRLLEEHLEQSDYLIVLCSANAAKSVYCQYEIQWFIEHKGPDKILAAFTEGINPPSDIATYFSPELIDHNIHQTVCYDFRDYKKGADKWEKVRDLSEEMTKLAAHLYDRSIKDIMPLWKRAERRQRIEKRINLLLRAGVTVLLTLLIALGWQRNEVVKALDVSELKSSVTGLANDAFKIKDNDRKLMYDTLMRAFDMIDETSLSIDRERNIIKNLITDVRINMTSLPLYSQTLPTQNSGEVLKIKTRGDRNGFVMFILSKDDNEVMKYELKSALESENFKIDGGTRLTNPSGHQIELFEPAESNLMFISDVSKNLKLIDYSGNLLDSLHIPHLIDFDFDKKTKWLYVATLHDWLAYKLDDRFQMKLIRRKARKNRKSRLSDTRRMKNYDDGMISFLYKNRLYLMDEGFRSDPVQIRFQNEQNENILYYKFSDLRQPNGRKDERGLLAISRGRIVEIYKRTANGAYFKSHIIDDHLSFINSFDFNSKNEIIVGSSDKTATVWSNFLLDKRLVGHVAPITDVSFVDDKLAITCDESHVIRLWNLEEIAVAVYSVPSIHPITSLKRIGSNQAGVQVGDSTLVLTYVDDTTTFLQPAISVLDSATLDHTFYYQRIHQFMDSSVVEQLTYIESGDTLFTGDKNGYLHMYVIPNRQPVLSWKAHDNAINDIDCTAGGGYLISGSRDNLIKVWKKSGNKYILSHTLDDHMDDVVDVDVFKNLFLTVSHDRSVLLYEIMEDGSIFRKISMIKHNTFINGAAFLNEEIIASGDDEGTIKVWSVKDFERMWEK